MTRPRLHRAWFRAAGVRGLRLPPMHRFSDTSAVMRAAALGIGAALARGRIAEAYLARGELLRLPGSSLKARSAYFAVYPAHRPPARIARAFIDWLQEQGRGTSSITATVPAPSQ